jgi:hypothetical protein
MAKVRGGVEVASGSRLVRFVRAVDRAYQLPPLVWIVRFLEWFPRWRWRWPVGVAVVACEWAVLYLTGAIG